MIHLGFLKLRLLVIFFVGVFFFLFIMGRALQLQLIPNKKLSELAERQYRTAVTLFPKRGGIFDRKMNELAVSRKVGSIFANPKKIKNPKYVARRLSRLTGMPETTLYKKLRSKRSFVWIKRLVSDSMTAYLNQYAIEGVGLLYEYKRFYPNQEVGGQVLGTVGVDSQGIEGIEYSHNDLLFGKKKSIVLIRDARGRPVTFDETLFMESQEGTSLILSIDKSLQFLVERELEAFVENYRARKGAALVQDVKTGEILVMAHYPFFNPNHLFSYTQDIWKNRAVVDMFEPGSTFKTFLSALALEKGIRPSDRFYCENGAYMVTKDVVIREAQNHKFEWMSFRDILKHSSNIGVTKIAFKLGKRDFHRKILEFGFGQKTEVGLSGEASGMVRPIHNWTKVDLSNIAFGQGISVTPIQLISAMSAIANGGVLMKPLLVKKKIDPRTGEVTETQPKVVRQVISAQTARELTKMLLTVTQQDGAGHLASAQEFSVAGKTGTAQKPNLERGGYSLDQYISSFLGFFPADRPRYSIFVMLDEPKKQYYASQVAAPLFKAVALHTSQLYPLKLKIINVHDQKNMMNIQSNRRIFKRSEESVVEEEFERMPDLRGKSMREVLEFASLAGLTLKVEGNGVAVHQSLPEGTLIVPGQKCMVTFREPSKSDPSSGEL